MNNNLKLGLYYRQSNIQCDYPGRVDCGDRPVCDHNDENCHDWHLTTTTKNPTPCDGIDCDHGDDFYPEGNAAIYLDKNILLCKIIIYYKYFLGVCKPCFCQCHDGVQDEICCPQPLVFNPATNTCDWTYNTDGC